MVYLLFGLLFALALLVWVLEVRLAGKTMLGRNAGARVSGPLFSMSASGTIGKAVTYGQWKGRQWARVWFKPQNPKSDKQVNVRYAMALLVAYWRTFPAGAKTTWDTYAAPFGMSGFNKTVGRGMDEYVIQITTAVKPVSVTIAGEPPADVWTWI